MSFCVTSKSKRRNSMTWKRTPETKFSAVHLSKHEVFRKMFNSFLRISSHNDFWDLCDHHLMKRLYGAIVCSDYVHIERNTWNGFVSSGDDAYDSISGSVLRAIHHPDAAIHSGSTRSLVRSRVRPSREVDLWPAGPGMVSLHWGPGRKSAELGPLSFLPQLLGSDFVLTFQCRGKLKYIIEGKFEISNCYHIFAHIIVVENQKFWDFSKEKMIFLVWDFSNYFI